MKKEEKLKYIKELLNTASSWRSYDGHRVENFIDEAKLKIAKIRSSDSNYIRDIDVFVSGKKREGIVSDWKEQIVTVLKKLQFEIETEEEGEKASVELIAIHCNKCNHTTKHAILKHVKETEKSQERVGSTLVDFWLDKHVQILKCISCGEFAMKTYDIWCEDFPNYPELNVRILPKRGSPSIKTSGHFKNVPPNIISLYNEVTDAFVNETNILCAGGIRAVLEAICIDKGVKGGNVQETINGVIQEKYKESLKAKIYGLCEGGFVTSKHSDILVHQQFLGDKALHELEKPSIEELEVAVDIIGDTLNSIYELEFKGQELKNRKEKRNKTS